MTKLELERAAIQIARDHIDNDSDMNIKIAEFVQENGLSVEHAKRLVERSNTQAFKTQFRKTAGQEFTMADSDKIIETLNIAPAETVSSGVVNSRYDYNESMSKAASNETETIVNYDIDNVNQHVTRIFQEKIDTASFEAREILKEARAVVNPLHSLEKTAEYLEKMPEAHYALALKFKNRVGDLNIAKKAMLEKDASLPAIARLIAKGAVKGVNMLAKGTAITSKGVIGAVKGGVKLSKSKIPIVDPLFIGGFGIAGGVGVAKNTGALSKYAELEKEASPLLKNFGGWKGVALGAAGLIGAEAGADFLGGYLKPKFDKNKREKAFNRMILEYPDLKEEDTATNEKYFETIFRHAPDIAMDPLVSGSLVKTFHQFGGVDYNTVKDLRATQNATAPRQGISERALTKTKALGGVAKLGLDLNKLEKEASITGFGRAKLETISATDPRNLQRILEREKEMKIQGETVGLLGGAAGGAAVGSKLTKGMSGLARLAGTGGAGLLGGLGGSRLLGEAGSAAATLGHKDSTGTSWEPNERELAHAVSRNVRNNPGKAYYHRLKRKVLLGL